MRPHCSSVDASGDRRDLRREAPFRGVGVEAHAQHRIVQCPFFQPEGGFRQNAADLFALYKNIVDPLDPGLSAGNLLHRLGGGGSGQGRQAPGGGRWPVPAQQGAEIYAGIRRGIEFPPQPSPAQGLAGRHQHGALRGSLVGPGFQQGVGGGHLIQHLDLPVLPAIQAAFDASQAQDIPAGQQPIAPAGLALNGIAPGPQGGNGLPHCRPGQIQALRQLLAGEIGPPAGRKKGQDPVFGCHGVHLAT